MKLAMTGLIFLVLCLGTAGFIGCGGSDTDTDTGSGAMPAAKDEPATAGERIVEAQTESGEKLDVRINESGSVGEDYGVPVYPGATESASMVIPGQGSMLTFSTDAKPQEVFAHYVSELEAQGWSITEANEAKLSVDATQGKKTASFRILGSGGGTEIAVILDGV